MHYVNILRYGGICGRAHEIEFLVMESSVSMEFGPFCRSLMRFIISLVYVRRPREPRIVSAASEVRLGPAG